MDNPWSKTSPMELLFWGSTIPPLFKKYVTSFLTSPIIDYDTLIELPLDY